jgi:hypothetical protein
MGRMPRPCLSNAASARLTLPTAGTVKGVCNNAWYVVQACCWAASHKNSSPHRVALADGEELIDTLDADHGKRRRGKFITPPTDFAEIVMEHLRTAGVHQSDKRDTIRFTALQGWPGEYIGAEGRFMEGEIERRAGIFIGPEFGTLSRVDLVAAAREATDARFDVLELDDVYETERQLFYVACTRARDRLLVSGVAPGSEFVGDLGNRRG